MTSGAIVGIQHLPYGEEVKASEQVGRFVARQICRVFFFLSIVAVRFA